MPITNDVKISSSNELLNVTEIEVIEPKLPLVEVHSDKKIDSSPSTILYNMDVHVEYIHSDIPEESRQVQNNYQNSIAAQPYATTSRGASCEPEQQFDIPEQLGIYNRQHSPVRRMRRKRLRNARVRRSSNPARWMKNFNTNIHRLQRLLKDPRYPVWIGMRSAHNQCKNKRNDGQRNISDNDGYEGDCESSN